jgi:hypothetical protein
MYIQYILVTSEVFLALFVHKNILIFNYLYGNDLYLGKITFIRLKIDISLRY